MSQGSCINYCKTNQYQYAITEDGEGEDEEDEDEDDSNGEDDSNDEDDENDDEEDDQGVEGGSGKAIHGKSIGMLSLNKTNKTIQYLGVLTNSYLSYS
ncbi:hypothetical protein BGZ59_004677 [Podila verticillata]|nr:hypothetical protein BGZ59_004677 [Podila verticillata]